MKRKIISGLLTGVLLLAVFLLIRPAQPVKIGFIAQLTGAYADLGVQGRNGFTLAVEQQNARGGINGQRIQTIIRDISNRSADIGETLTQLSAAKVAAVVGPMTSGQSLALLNRANRHHLVVLSPTASSPVLSRKDDYFFRIQPSTAVAAGELGRFAVLRQGVNRLALLYDIENSAYSRPFAANFSNAVHRAGGRVVCGNGYRSSNSANRQPFVRRLLAKNPQGVLLVSSARDSAVWVQLLKKAGFRGKVFLSGWARTDALFRFGRSVVDGAYIAYTQVKPRSKPDYRRFIRQYRARFGQSPSFAAAAGYDSANVLFFALKRQNGSLKERLLNLPPWHGVGGVFQFDRFGDVSKPVEIGLIRNGRIKVLFVTRVGVDR